MCSYTTLPFYSLARDVFTVYIATGLCQDIVRSYKITVISTVCVSYNQLVSSDFLRKMYMYKDAY
jgi:hypothetical protein